MKQTHTEESVRDKLDLNFDFGAISYLNEQCEINLLDGSLAEMDEKAFLDPAFYKKMIHAGLLHRFDEDVTDKEIREATKGLPPTFVIKAVHYAIAEATGQDPDTIEATAASIKKEADETVAKETASETSEDAGESESNSRT